MIRISPEGYLVSSIFPDSIQSGFGTIKTAVFGFENIPGVVCTMNQVHGNSIAVLSNEQPQGNYDGLIAHKSGLVLTVKTADCLPLFFYDVRKKVVAVVHAGWKGSLLRISEKMISKYIDLGSSTQDIKVAIGPGIGACCYEIYGERRNMFEKEFDEWREICENNHLNLLKLNYLQLLRSGVSKENIDYFPFCTKCDSKRFYSYNRNSTDERMISFIALS